VEYAKASPMDVLMRVTAVNRGPEPAELHVLPQEWYRNTWSWTADAPRPVVTAAGPAHLHLSHPRWLDFDLAYDAAFLSPSPLRGEGTRGSAGG
jgi:hypothetical protein